MTARMIVMASSLALAAGIAPFALAAPGDKPDKPDKPVKVRPGKARAPLTRPADGGDDNAKGRIDVARRPGNKLDLRIKGQRLDAGLAVDITIENGGDEVVLSDAVVTNDEGGIKLMLRTHKGDTLPLGAETLDDLAGATVRIRDDAAAPEAAPLLSGHVPQIGADLPRRLRLRTELALVEGQTDGAGHIQARFRGKDVRSELRMSVRGLAENDAVSFLIDDGTGTDTYVEFATATADADGEAQYRARTHHGGSLPLGVATVLDLLGRDVRIDVNGAPRLGGVIPTQE